MTVLATVLGRRIDDLGTRTDRTDDRLVSLTKEVGDLRTEVRVGFGEVKAEIADLDQRLSRAAA